MGKPNWDGTVWTRHTIDSDFDSVASVHSADFDQDGDWDVLGASVLTPQVAWWDPQRGWELENRGVEPDIEVVNLPQDLARGVDAQLDRAIREVLRLHEEQPPLRPDLGPVPPRGREAYREEGSRWSDER